MTPPDDLVGVSHAVLIALAGALVSGGLIQLILWYCHRNRAAVRTGEFHHAPAGETVPRFGGLALAGAFLVFIVLHGILHRWQCLRDGGALAVVVTSLTMFGVGFGMTSSRWGRARSFCCKSLWPWPPTVWACR